jgi:N-acyl-D-amino-acid deacylase
VTPRTLDFSGNWSGGMSMDRLVDGWFWVVQASDIEKLRLLRSEEWRAVAREEWDRVPRAMIPHQATDRLRLLTITRPENARWVGSTLADLVAARGGHASDVLADWLLENDLAPGVAAVGVANDDPAGVDGMLAHPASVVGNSDAGAHVKMMCATGDTTLLLTRHVRDRGDLTLEQAVHKITGQPAGLLGFNGRGEIRVGAAGDLAIFDLDELHWDVDVWADDLPGGRSRLRRPEGGYRATVVGGETTQERGVLTPARPGRVLRR